MIYYMIFNKIFKKEEIYKEEMNCCAGMQTAKQLKFKCN